MQLIVPRYRRNHFAALDGLRGIAALFVVALHALAPFGQAIAIPHAQLAVDFFFLLSGFVVAHAYEERLKSTLSVGQFVKVRLIRLYPLILVGLALGFLVYMAKAIVVEHDGFHGGAIVALIGGLLMLPTHTITNEGWGNICPFNVPAWSLCFEIYINIFYAAFLPKLSKRALNGILILSGIAVFAQAYHLGGVEGGGQWDEFIFGFGRVTFPFFFGVFLYRRKNITSGWSPPFLAIAALLAAAFVWPTPFMPVWLFESLAVVALFPLLVVWGSRCRSSAKVAAVNLFMGELSYPLYILHYPLIRLFSNLARRIAHNDLQIHILIGVEVTCQILFAFVVMKVFDEPVRAWLTRKCGAR
jgi:peptidoglycan/LPS O-acetylase OafA/YrhL